MSDELDRLRERDRELADARNRLGLEEQKPRPVPSRPARAPSEPSPIAALAGLLAIPEAYNRDSAPAERSDPRLDEQRRRQARIAKTLSILPPKLQAEVVQGAIQIENTKAHTEALQWEREGKHRALLMLGPVGAGKSLAAAAIAHASASRGKHSMSWHRPHGFVSAILHDYDDNSPRLGDHIVVVDDIGRGTERADVEEALNAFLDERTARLVMTSNLLPKEFRTRYDERLLNRLRECCATVFFKGTSRRVDGGAFKL